MMTYEWEDKIVLITGAATAIGAAVVRILMKENVKVSYCFLIYLQNEISNVVNLSR